MIFLGGFDDSIESISDEVLRKSDSLPAKQFFTIVVLDRSIYVRSVPILLGAISELVTSPSAPVCFVDSAIFFCRFEVPVDA